MSLECAHPGKKSSCITNQFVISPCKSERQSVYLSYVEGTHAFRHKPLLQSQQSASVSDVHTFSAWRWEYVMSSAPPAISNRASSGLMMYKSEGLKWVTPAYLTQRMPTGCKRKRWLHLCLLQQALSGRSSPTSGICFVLGRHKQLFCTPGNNGACLRETPWTSWSAPPPRCPSQHSVPRIVWDRHQHQQWCVGEGAGQRRWRTPTRSLDTHEEPCLSLSC